jgi:hypothetical protein
MANSGPALVILLLLEHAAEPKEHSCRQQEEEIPGWKLEQTVGDIGHDPSLLIDPSLKQSLSGVFTIVR